MPDRTFVILNISVWKPYLNSPTPAEFRCEYVLVGIPLHVVRRYLQPCDFLILFWHPANCYIITISGCCFSIWSLSYDFLRNSKFIQLLDILHIVLSCPKGAPHPISCPNLCNGHHLFSTLQSATWAPGPETSVRNHLNRSSFKTKHF